MKIQLFRDHTALLIDDKSPTVTVEPFAVGVLEIEGHRFHISAKGTKTPCLPELIGHARVSFTDGRGVRYLGIKPRFVQGTPYSTADYAGEYVNMRIRMDDLERQVESLSKEFHKLSAENQHNALGKITKNTKKKEA